VRRGSNFEKEKKLALRRFAGVLKLKLKKLLVFIEK
jgi:hypothetical protein